jgi:hypothetical protein
MTLPRHTAEEIAAFIGDGETRFIAAGYRDSARAAELFVMPDGEAAMLRTFTRLNLRCLIADCSAPDIIAVSRERRRDGFSHRAGGGRHAPESVNHLQGKAVLALWLRSQLPDADIQVEGATDTQRSRVADVLVTLPDGQRVAFEVQYAPLTVKDWRERHASYVSQGITDIWLWGHTRLHRSRSSYDPPIRLSDVQDEVRRAGLAVHWLNPETAEIATAVTRLSNDHIVWIEDQLGEVAVQKLNELGLAAEGFTSVELSRIADLTRRWAAEKERRRVEREQREAARAAQRQRRAAEQEARRATAVAPRPDRTERTARAPEGTRPCRVCGKPVAAFLASGIHIGCEPGFWAGPRPPR